MSASRDGTRIANFTSTGVDIHDGRTGDVLGTIDAANVGAVFITIADQLVVSTNDGTLTLYGLDDLQPIRTFPGSRGRVEQLTSTNDGSIIAARGGDRTVSIFDTATGTQLGKSIVIADGEVNFISLAPDGSTLAVGGGGRLRLPGEDLEPRPGVVGRRRLPTGRPQPHARGVGLVHRRSRAVRRDVPGVPARRLRCRTGTGATAPRRVRRTADGRARWR